LQEQRCGFRSCSLHLDSGKQGEDSLNKANFLRLATLAVLAGSVYAQEKMGAQPEPMASPENTATSASQGPAGKAQEQQPMMMNSHDSQSMDSQQMNDMGSTHKKHKMKKEKVKKQDKTNRDSVDQYDPMAGNWG
jgi:hypothetical protein